MEISLDQYNRILARLTSLEQKFDDFAVAINKFVTLTEINQLLTTITTDIQNANETLEALESRLNIVENEPID